ncbi:hypothetical protein [Williamsia herbipolensis]|uniref:hypothetical protein n=1 Tax=Williamsia herbipolensis TaxID=1603258 RepID=UPI0005F81111|nr:hypothetical protein [Williamsia herbipolensis]
MAPTVSPPDLTGIDPSTKSAIEWGTRLAALASHGTPHDDPRVVEARAALAFHRVKRAIDAERGQLDEHHLDALCESLRAAQAGVPA